MLFNALHRLELYPFVRVLYHEPVVLLQLCMGFPDELNRSFAQSWYSSIDLILGAIVRQYIHLQIKMLLLVLL